MVDRRPKRCARQSNASVDDHIDWFMWRPCTGIPGVLPPLTSWDKLDDGSITLATVEEMNQVIDAILDKRAAMAANG